MTLRELIEANGIDKAHLARCIGMSKGTFGNKLHGNNNARFSGGEMVMLLGELDKIRKEITNFIKSV